MADRTSIEWTDATWTPIKGCSRASHGCVNCYAEVMAARFSLPGQWGEGLAKIVDTPQGKDHRWTGKTRFDDRELVKPLSWKKPRQIFVCSTSDLFHESVPNEWIDQVFAVMGSCPQHTFQVLTKRADRMREYLTARKAAAPIMVPVGDGTLGQHPFNNELKEPSNIWLGVSVEDQAHADNRIPDLIFTPAAVRFLSVEPLLGPIDLTAIKAPREPDEPDLDIDWRFDALEVGDYYWWNGTDDQPGDCGDGPYRDGRIDWVIVGGESGPGARPMHPHWVRAIRDQCAAATIHGDDAPVPFFFKQWGAWVTYLDRDMQDPDWRADYSRLERSETFRFLNLAGGCGFHGERLHVMQRVGKKAAGRLLDGVQHDGVPV
ncbi:hypothetical protein AI27_06545 [Sphingomonas sp. BHC-A]|nr:hypothetical protein AI27_06545 [Sphingomonas sp. BHC-A]